VRLGDDLDESALLDLFRAVIANNRAGGWRTITSARAADPGVPATDETADRMG
jgi:hypothetical protein